MKVRRKGFTRRDAGLHWREDDHGIHQKWTHSVDACCTRDASKDHHIVVVLFFFNEKQNKTKKHQHILELYFLVFEGFFLKNYSLKSLTGLGTWVMVHSLFLLLSCNFRLLWPTEEGAENLTITSLVIEQHISYSLPGILLYSFFQSSLL